MMPPAFWTRLGWPARLLRPLGQVTAIVTARRVARPGWVAPVPVFCCGNASMGGTGKTIVALDLGRRLRARGRDVHFLTRGYGGRVSAPLQVDRRIHDAALVGDEPLLLAEVAPCWVGADRAAAARAAIGAGAEVLVMDDGLQHPGLAGRHSALVIDGVAGFGNGCLFPAGPLRESAAAAAARCDIAVIIGADTAGAAQALPPALEVLRARLVTEGDWAGRRLHAFAGIGRPAKFFAGLEQAGATLAGTTSFPDHHRYMPRDLRRLQARAGGAALVTTAKDAVRLPHPFRETVAVADVALAWERPEAIELWLGAT